MENTLLYIYLNLYARNFFLTFIKKKKKRKYSKFSFFRKEKFLLRMAFCITKKAFVGKILFSLKKLLKNSSQSYVLQLFVYFGISSILGKNCR